MQGKMSPTPGRGNRVNGRSRTEQSSTVIFERRQEMKLSPTHKQSGFAFAEKC